MKNYLVTALHRFTDYGSILHRDQRMGSKLGGGAELGKVEVDPYDGYKAMEIIHTKSFKKHLKGDFEYILFGGESKNVRDMFRKQFLFLRKLWEEGDCNILYCGPDTLCCKDLYIFDTFKRMRMFNYTEPHNLFDVDNYFNADVVYYPAEMDGRLWDLGERLWQKVLDPESASVAFRDQISQEDYAFANMQKWGCDQYILNRMFWAQGIPLQAALIPKYNFMCQYLPSRAEVERFNKMSIDEGLILHITASRGWESSLEYMKKIDELGTGEKVLEPFFGTAGIIR